jgi:protein required for attachment to host cells
MEQYMESEYLIVVGDGTRARFFTLEAAALPPLESSPRLMEHEDLVNAEHMQGGHDKYSSTRTGINLNPRGGPSHGYDDHRAQQEQEHERRFAADITARALSLAQQHRATQLVLVAEPHMLGLLRDALKIPAKSGIDVRDLAKDLTKLTTTQLHGQLAAAGLVPARHEPQGG